MALPVVSAASSDLVGLGQAMQSACRKGGMFYLVDHGIDSRLIESLLAESAAFFATSAEEKNSIHIKNSSNHRGYGLLKNYRDWREQIHLGVDAPGYMQQDSAAPYWSLWGANQWPASGGEKFKTTMLAYFAAVDALARRILSALALALEKPEDYFTGRMKDRPYLLMKAMSYLPQEQNTADLQSGVTAHCDWSWLTFLIQDQVGGLEAQDADGLWQPVDPIAGAIVVNTGELLEIESGGIFCASPHRVINARIDRQRYSVPVFINPSLDAEIFPAGIFVEASNRSTDETAHVHKVIKPGTILSPFTFGASEYTRKAEGKWCYRSQCLVPV
ncbi:MAG: isopenicillin N synthase family oxygenase [Cyanobacteria bacterium SZAS LIN-3]|nr:isopenicillin N synthase family oxygenase [Cyanobacteria bacterium SZAS LIN-3]